MTATTFSLLAGDGDEERLARRSVHALAAARSSGMPAAPDAGVVAGDPRDVDACGIRRLDLDPGAVELAAGEVGERGDGRVLPLVLAAGDGREVLDVHRAEALGARLHGHERAVGVRPEAVLLGGGHGCAGHLSGHS